MKRKTHNTHKYGTSIWAPDLEGTFYYFGFRLPPTPGHQGGTVLFKTSNQNQTIRTSVTE